MKVERGREGKSGSKIFKYARLLLRICEETRRTILLFVWNTFLPIPVAIEFYGEKTITKSNYVTNIGKNMEINILVL